MIAPCIRIDSGTGGEYGKGERLVVEGTQMPQNQMSSGPGVRTVLALERAAIREVWLSRRGSYAEAVAECESRGLIRAGVHSTLVER